MLTGFILDSYRSLRPDISQITSDTLLHVSQQLAQISDQLWNGSSIPSISAATTEVFRMSGSATWINVLWFLSLVLSLAAALFGVVEKQWLRKYIQWTTMSRPAEDRVQLRQGRYEAFMDWKTPTIIATIPALLEYALILFLIGMEGLLWTLDDAVVFTISTVAIGVLILLGVIATVLPACCPRCPYKTPVGWACVVVKRALRTKLARFLDFTVGRCLTAW